MALFTASLNSGSNGNCYYIGTQEEAVLIDAGLSCRETEKRLKRLKLDIKKVKAIFITHEHGDHIHGVANLSRKHQVPVYITDLTNRFSNLKIDETRIQSFNSCEPIQIGSLEITAFTKFHDACDPHSFTVRTQDLNDPEKKSPLVSLRI